MECFFQNIDFPVQIYTVAKLVKINVSPILKYCLTMPTIQHKNPLDLCLSKISS